MEKKMYRVFVSYEMAGFHTVEAESQEDAENQIDRDDISLPENGDYVGGSCQVDREFTLVLENNEWVECQN